jgi:hypothetical protein
VVLALAEFPFSDRVEPLVEVAAEEGTWILARPTEVVERAAESEGCLVGDSDAVETEEVICVAEYGEVLLVDGAGHIVRAYPMPDAVPTWIAVVPGVVYAGRIGDGAWPDSAVVRIDRRTLEAQMLAIQSSAEPGLVRRWPDTWNVATAEQAQLYRQVVRLNQDGTGVEAVSWTGPVVMDPEGIDRLFEGLSH